MFLLPQSDEYLGGSQVCPLRLPPARNLESTKGTFPDARRFTISLREEQIVFCNVTSAAFSRCWIRNPDGPHTVAFGKDLKTDKILKSGGRIGGLSNESLGGITGGAAFGCFVLLYPSSQS